MVNKKDQARFCKFVPECPTQYMMKHRVRVCRVYTFVLLAKV